MGVDDTTVIDVGQRNRSTFRKIVETGALVFSWIVMGMYAEITGPALIDLKYRLKTGYEELAVALSAGGVGTFPGCVIGGFLVDKFSGYSHLMVAITLDIAAAAVVLMPWVPSVIHLWALCFISGLVETIHNAAGTRINLNIWKDESASPIILMHLGYGIGSFLTPLYANPFLGTQVHNITDIGITSNNVSTDNTTVSSPNLSERTVFLENSRIEYAFAISGIAAASLSIIFFILQYFENKIIKQFRDIETRHSTEVENDNYSGIQEVTGRIVGTKKQGKELKINNKCNSVLKMINPASCPKGRFWYGSSILFFMFFYFGNSGGGQGFTSKFLRSFSIDQLNFSSADGSLLNTSFWISFSVGRFIFFIIARFVSVKVLIVLETGSILCSAILMAIFGNNDSTALWILIQPIAFFIGPLWPTGIAWTDYHIELTGMGMAAQMLGSALGYILHMRLIGYLYDNIGPHTYVYHVAGSAILGVILAVVLDIIGAKHGNRFVNERVPSTEEENESSNRDDCETKETVISGNVIMVTKL